MKLLILLLCMIGFSAFGQNPIFNALLSQPASSGTSYWRTVTVNHAYVSGTSVTTQSNFPVLVSIVLPSSHVTSINAYDVNFFSNSGLTSKLAWEIENVVISGTAMTINAWVNLPTISSTADTVFYVGYGNPAITTFQGNVNATWNSNFKNVWHLPNGTTLSTNDSTANGNNGTNSNTTATTGIIDGGGSFNGSSSYITLTSGTSASLAFGIGDFTYSLWVYPTSVASLGALYDGLNLGGAYGRLTSLVIVLQTGSNLNFYSQNNFQYPSATLLTLNAWNMVTLTSVSSVFQWYINGVKDTNTRSGFTLVNSTGGQTIGVTADSPGDYFTGKLDEIRAVGVGESSDWIATEYNNQSAPSTFITLGAEQ